MRRWFSMKKLDDKSGEVLIYDEIGKSWWNEDAMSAKHFDDELKALGDVESIILRINSPGGDAFDGLAIHNTIKNHAATFTAQIDGIAASAASIIAMAADTIVMPENAFVLIHGASGFAMGNAQDMRAMADDLDRLDKSIVATYANRSGQDIEKIQSIMKEDRLMDANEAKGLGLCDEIKGAAKMAATYSLRLLPPNAAAKFKTVIEPTDEREPPSGTSVVEPGPQQQQQLQSQGPAPTTRNENGGGAEVISLDAARAEGSEQAMSYVNEVNSLCALAGMPAMARDFIAKKEAVDNVRKKLIEARASADERLEAQHHRAMPTQAAREKTAAAWSRVADQLNARLRK